MAYNLINWIKNIEMMLKNIVKKQNNPYKINGKKYLLISIHQSIKGSMDHLNFIEKDKF